MTITPEQGTIIDGWLAGRPKNTARAYRTRIGAWVAWCEQHGAAPFAPTEADCRAYHRHLVDTSPSNETVRAHVTAVRSLLAYARRHGASPDADPWDAVDVVTVPNVSTTPYLTPDEHRRLLDHAATHAAPNVYAFVRVCGILGHRLDAALSFNLGQLHETGDGWRYRYRGKGSRTHDAPVDDETMDAIRAAVGERSTGLLFPAAGDNPTQPIDPTTARRWLRRLCAAAGVSYVPPHGLRHSAITRALEVTGDLDAARAFAGHASAQTTSRYDRRTDGATKALAAIVTTTRTPPASA